jgi:hypothetical protein
MPRVSAGLRESQWFDGGAFFAISNAAVRTLTKLSSVEKWMVLYYCVYIGQAGPSGKGRGYLFVCHTVVAHDGHDYLLARRLGCFLLRSGDPELV